MFKTILWATDGSANADRALPLVKELAAAEGATVLVAHCRELLSGRAAGFPVHADEDEVVAKIRRQAAELESVGFNVRVDVVAASGANAQVIADIARNDDADVIVVGTRGHSPFVGALLGSVTQRLLHIAPCPVLAVPALELEHSKEATLTASAAG